MPAKPAIKQIYIYDEKLEINFFLSLSTKIAILIEFNVCVFCVLRPSVCVFCDFNIFVFACEWSPIGSKIIN